MWKKLYTSYVRPLLEFAIPVWNPYQKSDISKLESVQHRATKIAHGLKSKNYEERCKFLNLTNLGERRTREDLIQKYKIKNKMKLNGLLLQLVVTHEAVTDVIS